MKKIIAIASAGGHFVQLKRIAHKLAVEKNIETIFITTKVGGASVYDSNYLVEDVSRDNLIGVFSLLKSAWNIYMKEKPSAIISTGALPGLVFIFIFRLLGVKTIWIDSIANSTKLSLSGRFASYISHISLTQWPHLETGKTKYKGGVL